MGRWHGPGNAASCLRCAIFRGIRLLGTSLLRSAQGASLLQRCECYHNPALGFKGVPPGEGGVAGCSPSLRFDIISPVGRGEILSGSWRLDAPRIDSAVSENTATIDRMDSMMDRHCLLGRALSSCIHTGLLQGFPKCMVGSTPLFHASGSPAVSRACAEGERG